VGISTKFANVSNLRIRVHQVDAVEFWKDEDKEECGLDFETSVTILIIRVLLLGTSVASPRAVVHGEQAELLVIVSSVDSLIKSCFNLAQVSLDRRMSTPDSDELMFQSIDRDNKWWLLT
jgi:hypothetical protein